MNVGNSSSTLEIDPKLLEILACPESHQPLRLMSVQELDKFNEQLSRSQIRDLGGNVVIGPWKSGLIRQDEQRIYVIRDGLPILLVDAGVIPPR